MNAAAYLDSSAVVKLYVREAGSAEVLKLAGQGGPLVCSALGYIEVRAALAAAARSQRLAVPDYTAAVASFRADWASYSIVAADEPLLERAAELAEGFGLRGYDSLHLASAERVRLVLPTTLFVCFDTVLNRAAKLLGFALPAFVPL